VSLLDVSVLILVRILNIKFYCTLCIDVQKDTQNGLLLSGTSHKAPDGMTIAGD